MRPKRWTVMVALLLSAPGVLWAGDKLTLDGPRMQGALIQGKTEPGAEVDFRGEPVRVSDQGRFLLGLGRDAPSHAQLVVSLPEGRTLKRTLDIEQRDYDIQRIDGLPPKKVTPDPNALKRIRSDVAEVKRARSTDDARTDFDSGFIWPVTGPITGVYGSQRVLNGKPRRPHYGVDIAAPTGTKVVAPADGVVTMANPDMYFSGGTLIVDHGYGLSSSFLHLSKILVNKGQRVRRGEAIAEVGATGRVTGAHLDWRMNVHGARIDPELLVGPMPQRKTAGETHE